VFRLLRHRAKPAHRDLQARLVHPDPQESQERQELPDALAPTPLQVHPDPVAHQDLPESPDHKVPQANPEFQPSQSPLLLESQESLEKPDHQAQLDLRDPLEPTDPLDHLDRKDLQAPMDLPEPMVIPDHRDRLDHKDPQERKVSARSTVPSTEESSSRTALADKRREQGGSSATRTSAIVSIVDRTCHQMLFPPFFGHGFALAMSFQHPAYNYYLGPLAILLLLKLVSPKQKK